MSNFRYIWILACIMIVVVEGFSSRTSRRRPISLETPTTISFFHFVAPVPTPLWHTATPSRTYHHHRSLLKSSNNNDNIPNSEMDPGLKLLICVLIDFVGVISYAAPGLGEATDVAWAPISALLVQYLFGNGVFSALALTEELLPGFDVIPTATIAWFWEQQQQQQQPESPVVNRQGEKNESIKSKQSKYASDAIDVEVVE